MFLNDGVSQIAVVPEALDVVELLEQTGEVAAVVEAGVRRVVAVREAVTGYAGRVVGRVAVGEAVGHHEVETLASEILAQAGAGELSVRIGGRRLLPPPDTIVTRWLAWS